MRGWMMLAAALVATPAVAAQPDKLTAADIELSVKAITDFEASARYEPASMNEKAMNVCRVALGQSFRGIHETTDAITSYSGPGKEVLSLICSGYLQAAHDVLSEMPNQQSKEQRP